MDPNLQKLGFKDSADFCVKKHLIKSESLTDNFFKRSEKKSKNLQFILDQCSRFGYNLSTEIKIFNKF